MHVAFDTRNVYYLPQYSPVIRELARRGHQCSLVCYEDKDDRAKVSPVLEAVGTPVHWSPNEEAAASHYASLQPEWIVFGSGFKHMEKLHPNTQAAQLGHGIGPKPSYYTKSWKSMSVRFIEGAARHETIRSRYPRGNFQKVGFSKLDPLFDGTAEGLDLAKVGLVPGRPTILFAPTYNPSSLERFPRSWPSDFASCNVLVKPHTFTYTRAAYRGQRRRLRHWAKHPNVHVAGAEAISLLPYMIAADLLLSEASSTLFEFAALDRPVVVCDFFKLKLSYRGPLRYRFERRFRRGHVSFDGIGARASSYPELLKVIPEQLADPGQYAAARARFTRDHVGPTDVRSSERIVDYLEQNASTLTRG